MFKTNLITSDALKIEPITVVKTLMDLVLFFFSIARAKSSSTGDFKHLNLKVIQAYSETVSVTGFRLRF
mgnify:CR=1 FL=1